MANGKIIYTPITTYTLLFDGTHYLSLDEPAFNPGSGSLGVDALLAVDPAVVDTECWIAAKGTATLANAAGWHFYYKPGTRRLGLRINDGGTTALVIETADNQIPALGTKFWPRLEVDRAADLARFYVNGALAGSGDISAIAGSLDNAEPLRVGGYDAATHRHQGSLDLLRVDLGRVLTAAWHTAEWDRLRYGCKREAQDFLAVWTFAESLVEISANAYELTWQGGGDPAYGAGWPGSAGPISYLFAENYQRGWQPGYINLDDNQRMADASAYNYPAPNQKKTFLLPFEYIQPEQQAAFKAAWDGKQPVDLFLNADLPKVDGQFQIKMFPLLQQAFCDRFKAQLDLEQV